MQWCEPVLVLAQEREDEPELVHHARVRAQRRVPRDDQVREAVYTPGLGWSLGLHRAGRRTNDAHGGEELAAKADPSVLRARPAPALLEAILRARLVCDETRPRVLLLHVQKDALHVYASSVSSLGATLCGCTHLGDVILAERAECLRDALQPPVHRDAPLQAERQRQHQLPTSFPSLSIINYQSGTPSSVP